MIPDTKDIQGLEAKFDKQFLTWEKDTTLSNQNKKLILKYLNDGLIGKAGKKRIGKARLYRSAGILKLMANNWFKKDLDKLNEQDMETFVTELESGKVKNVYGKPYKSETKTTILKFIKKYYRYLGKSELVGWIDAGHEQAVTQALTEQEIIKLMDNTGEHRNKTIIQLLFDSGARIEEFLNLKFKDVAWKGEYYTLNIRVSKTKPRIVSVPMKRSTELLREWLLQNREKKQEEFLFEVSYDNTKKILKRLGDKAIGKNCYPHLFRHSSMTYYANLLKHYQFAKRYGLALNSDVVNRYIDLSGINEEETHNIIKATREQDLEKKLAEQEHKTTMMQEQINLFMKVIQENPELLQRIKITPQSKIKEAVKRKH